VVVAVAAVMVAAVAQEVLEVDQVSLFLEALLLLLL
jgi:hypothetical protein